MHHKAFGSCALPKPTGQLKGAPPYLAGFSWCKCNPPREGTADGYRKRERRIEQVLSFDPTSFPRQFWTSLGLDAKPCCHT